MPTVADVDEKLDTLQAEFAAVRASLLGLNGDPGRIGNLESDHESQWRKLRMLEGKLDSLTIKMGFIAGGIAVAGTLLAELALKGLGL